MVIQFGGMEPNREKLGHIVTLETATSPATNAVAV